MACKEGKLEGGKVSSQKTLRDQMDASFRPKRLGSRMNNEILDTLLLQHLLFGLDQCRL